MPTLPLAVSRQHQIRDLAAKGLHRLGLTRRLLRRPRGERIVLLYHNPKPEVFAQHIEFLTRFYRILPAPGLDAPSQRSGPSVSITFDDGYRGVLTNIVPILQRAQVPAVMFIPTGFLGRGFGYEALRIAFQKTPLSSHSFEGRHYTLSDPGRRKDAWLAACASLKLASAQERDARITSLLAAIQVPQSELSDAAVVSRDELRTLAAHLEIGSHTVTHPNLARLSLSEIRRELIDSRLEIEAIVGRPCRIFAYPIGRSDDYDSRAYGLLREAGYEKAFTAIPSTDPSSDFEYPRIGIGDQDSIETLSLKLSLIWSSLFRLLGDRPSR